MIHTHSIEAATDIRVCNDTKQGRGNMQSQIHIRHVDTVSFSCQPLKFYAKSWY